MVFLIRKWPATKLKNIYPPADVLKNLADAFGTTIDYLVMGDTFSKAQTSLNDANSLTSLKKYLLYPMKKNPGAQNDHRLHQRL